MPAYKRALNAILRAFADGQPQKVDMCMWTGEVTQKVKEGVCHTGLKTCVPSSEAV